MLDMEIFIGIIYLIFFFGEELSLKKFSKFKDWFKVLKLI